jgi:hypothetical protein
MLLCLCLGRRGRAHSAQMISRCALDKLQRACPARKIHAQLMIFRASARRRRWALTDTESQMECRDGECDARVQRPGALFAACLFHELFKQPLCTAAQAAEHKHRCCAYDLLTFPPMSKREGKWKVSKNTCTSDGSQWKNS